jgi:hypothetical protein
LLSTNGCYHGPIYIRPGTWDVIFFPKHHPGHDVVVELCLGKYGAWVSTV